MDRYREPLLLGLASLAVYAGGRLLFELSSVVIDGRALSGALVYVPGLAYLGYVAALRRSPLGLVAVVATYLMALAVFSLVL